MIFHRERGIRRVSPKADVLALHPTAFSQCKYGITGSRVFYVCLGDRTLAKGISPRSVWEKALEVLNDEMERE